MISLRSRLSRNDKPRDMAFRHEVTHSAADAASNRCSKGENTCSSPKVESDSLRIEQRLFGQAPRVRRAKTALPAPPKDVETDRPNACPEPNALRRTQHSRRFLRPKTLHSSNTG